ncbi:MAG: hypothetical protein NT016_00605 [Candidatus Aenigmarchaeota archaeon]|nr:hypothetical protein [Candidatus Aenigmarchaeota archaeon]
MPKRAARAASMSWMETHSEWLLSLMIATACIVFSFIFTVLTALLGPIASDIKVIFIMLLVLTTTVASTVSLIFYMLVVNNVGARLKRTSRRRR